MRDDGLPARAAIHQGLPAPMPREVVFEATRRDVVSPISFTTEAVTGYVGSSIAHSHQVARVPDLDEPLVVTRRCTVFVAEAGS